MFLTNDELQVLTGAVQPKKMIEWLKAEGFNFKVGLDGHPVVLKDHVRRILGAEASAARKKPQVDLSWQRSALQPV